MSSRSAQKHVNLAKIIIIICALLLTPIVAVSLPLNRSDGLENYTGAELEAAKEALAYHSAKGDSKLLVIRSRVENVFLTPENEPMCKFGDGGGEYTVTVRDLWIFGLTYVKKDYPGCITSGDS